MSVQLLRFQFTRNSLCSAFLSGRIVGGEYWMLQVYACQVLHILFKFFKLVFYANLSFTCLLLDLWRPYTWFLKRKLELLDTQITIDLCCFFIEHFPSWHVRATISIRGNTGFVASRSLVMIRKVYVWFSTAPRIQKHQVQYLSALNTRSSLKTKVDFYDHKDTFQKISLWS